MGQCAPASAPANFRHATVMTQGAQRLVRLAITPLNTKIVTSKFTAYHTSISVDDIELSFDGEGIRIEKDFASHRNSVGNVRLAGPAVVRDLGMTTSSVEELLEVMQPHFQPGSYDLLLKNCNSFSDCALSYLLGKRLDEDFSSLERIAAFAETNFNLLGLLTGYTPNPQAVLFQKDKTKEQLMSLSGHLEKRVMRSVKNLKSQGKDMWV